MRRLNLFIGSLIWRDNRGSKIHNASLSEGAERRPKRRSLQLLNVGLFSLLSALLRRLQPRVADVPARAMAADVETPHAVSERDHERGRVRVLLGRRRVRVGLAFVIALLVAGAAFAYFTSSGSGSGSASSGTAQNVSITAGVTPTSPLVPGGSGDVTVSISNPNTFRVFIPALALDTSQGTGGFGVDGSHSGCDVSTLGFTTQDNSGAGWFVPKKVVANGVLNLDLSGSISMGVGAANACQGATFTVYLEVVS